MASGHHYRTAQFYVVSTNICQHFLHVLDWVACTLLGLTTKTASEGSTDENLTTNWIHLVLKVIFFCWIFAIVSISLHLSLYYKCSRLSSLKRTFFSFINMNFFFLEQKKVADAWFCSMTGAYIHCSSDLFSALFLKSINKFWNQYFLECSCFLDNHGVCIRIPLSPCRYKILPLTSWCTYRCTWVIYCKTQVSQN